MTKIFKYSSGVLLILGLTVSLSGCLKTNPYYEGYQDLTPLADINLSNLSNSSDSTTLYAFDIPSNPSTLVDTAIAVHLSDKNHVGNVTFTMATAFDDTTFLNMYNNNQAVYKIENSEALYDAQDSATQAYCDNYITNFPQWTLLPDSLYSIPSLSVTIQNAGVLNVGTMPINFKVGALDSKGTPLFASHTYILPIKIQDAGGYQIASNFREIFMVLQGKNKYDADYKITDTVINKGSVIYSGTNTEHLYTTGTNSNERKTLGHYFDGDLTFFTFNSNGTVGITWDGGSANVLSSSFDPSTGNFSVTFTILSGSYKFIETYIKQ